MEILSFLCALTLFVQISAPHYLRLFSVLLFVTVVIELSAVVLVPKYPVLVINMYNFFTTFEIEFYLLMIRFMIQSRVIKKIILYVLCIYPVLAILNVLIIQKGGFHTITYSLGCLLVVSAAIYYFFELFRLPKSVDLLRESAFWVCTALLFYHTCTFMLTGLWNQLHLLPEVVLNNVTRIFTILNFLLYLLFCIAFLCRIRFRKL